jgi:4-hydroxy 2-oxovalerate aldolase
MNKTVKLYDSTLRDGSHAVHHQYDEEIVKNVCKGMEEAGVYAVEVGHGGGLGGSTIQFGFGKISDDLLLKAAKSVLKNTKLSALLVPGLGTMEDLKMAAECGVDIVRVAVHCTELDVGMQHIKLTKELGLEAAAFFMMSHMISPDDLAKQAEIAQSYGVDYIFIADSSGAMTPQDIRERVVKVKAVVNVPVGVHCHNNLALGVGNSVAAFEAGADIIDGTLQGLGAGCGNTPTEVLAAVFNKMNVETGCDMFKLMDVGEKFIVPIKPRPIEVTNETLILGYTGIYSSFYLHTLDVAKRYNLDPRDIFVELGNRKVVGGQEDMIINVALDLINKKK